VFWSVFLPPWSWINEPCCLYVCHFSMEFVIHCSKIDFFSKEYQVSGNNDSTCTVRLCKCCLLIMNLIFIIQQNFGCVCCEYSFFYLSASGIPFRHWWWSQNMQVHDLIYTYTCVVCVMFLTLYDFFCVMK